MPSARNPLPEALLRRNLCPPPCVNHGMLRSLPRDRWNLTTAAHLLHRAGFGGTPADIQSLADRGPEGAVEFLLGFEALPPSDTATPASDPPNLRESLEAWRSLAALPAKERQERLQALRRQQFQITEDLRRSWLERMVFGPHPLQEKLVLFWHGHFATSIQKVRQPTLMQGQLDLFRHYAAGHWPTLLDKIVHDPALLLWLDQAQSRPQRPNENLARELLELFTLGEGQYSETDIREAARAFTGLSVDRARLETVWRPRAHDAGAKSFLGHQGTFGPKDIIHILAEDPRSGRYLASRLWSFFAQDPPARGIPEALGAVLTSAQGQLRPLLQTLFLAEEFYHSDLLRAQIKSPVQWLVMALRQLERPLPPGPLPTQALRQLGQDLLAPPNVKGWEGGRAWINTQTLTLRQQYAEALVLGPRSNLRPAGPGPRPMNPRVPPASPSESRLDQWFPAELRRDRKQLQHALAARFLHAPLRPNLAEAIEEAMGDDQPPSNAAILAALRTLLRSTDYQLT